MRRTLLIHLHSDVDCFSIKPRHIAKIGEAFPDITIIVAEGREEFMGKLPHADWVMTWTFQPEWYSKAPNLQAVFTPAAGREWVVADPDGRVATHYGRFHGRIMRESLLAMMLYFNRRLQKSIEDKNDKRWDREDYDGCSALFSQRVLIVGYGSIGRQIAELLRAFGAGIVGIKRDAGMFANDLNTERVVTFDNLQEELPRADHVVLVLPGGTETEGIVTAAHFRCMKPGSFLYNLGRGNCYREADLVNALLNGPVAGAGLDVFGEEPLPPSSPLWDLPNVLITPHASAFSQEYLDLYIEEWIDTMRTIQSDKG